MKQIGKTKTYYLLYDIKKQFDNLIRVAGAPLRTTTTTTTIA